MLKVLIIAFIAMGAAYMFVLRNRKMKLEVEFEMDPPVTVGEPTADVFEA